MVHLTLKTRDERNVKTEGCNYSRQSLNNEHTGIVFCVYMFHEVKSMTVCRSVSVMVYKHPYLLQNLPHHAGCVSGAGDEVDAAVVR